MDTLNIGKMEYLVCEKCGGYYLLMEGESIDDFDSCQCGGKFYLVKMGNDGETIEVEPSEFDTFKQDIPKHDVTEVETEPPNLICGECGRVNDVNTAFCRGCGQILVPARELGGADNSSSVKPKLTIFAGFTVIILSLVLLGFLF